jgi:hypothetical protein
MRFSKHKCLKKRMDTAVPLSLCLHPQINGLTDLQVSSRTKSSEDTTPHRLP